MSKVTPFAYRVKSMVKIIDGDTFDCVLDLGFDVLLEARIRMARIDTPASRTRDLIEKQFGLASKKYLIERIEAAQDIIVRTELDNEKGKFGRILGTVYLDDVDVNQQMIQDGYAVGYHGQNKNAIKEQHLVNRDRLLTENKVQLDTNFGK